MGLSDVTGVLSRYFVVGFFLPAYASLIALWLAASSGFVPGLLEQRHSQGTQIVILGGVAVVAALLLSGLSYPLTRLFEGYPLLRLRRLPLLSLIPRAALALQRQSYDRLLRVRNDEARPESERARALWALDQFFPRDPTKLLPTRIGNAMRAYERHSNERWGLDGVTVWPRIEPLLDDEERDLHVDAKIDLYVFLNGAVGSFAVGVCLVVDKAVHHPNGPGMWALYAIPFVAAYALYRAAIGPAVRRGSAVRASIDLHRLELYEKLGVRVPASFSDERQMAVRINQALLYGRPYLDDNDWRGAIEEPGPAPAGNDRASLFDLLEEWMRR